MPISTSAALVHYTVWPATAIVVTLIRLTIRQQDALFWWDDALALLSALATVLLSVAGWMHFHIDELPHQTTKVATYYIMAESFYVALWSARSSILFSLLRLVCTPRAQKTLKCAAVLFAITWALLFSQLWWVCAPMKGWQSHAAPQCPLTMQVVVFQLVADVSSDLLLIAVPVHMFITSTLERSLKIRLSAIFSATVLTTVVSVVHAYYILRVGGPAVLVAAVVEVAVSLIVCNLSVVVTALHRVCSSSKLFGGSAATQERHGVSLPVFARFTGKPATAATTTPTFHLTEVGMQKTASSDAESDVPTHRLSGARVSDSSDRYASLPPSFGAAWHDKLP